MKNNNFKGVSYTTGFFMLIGFSILGLIIAGGIGLLIFMAATGQNTADLKNLMTSPENAGIARIIQIITVVLSMFLPAWMVAFILHKKPFQLLGFKSGVQTKQVGLIIFIVLVSLFIAGALGWFNKWIPIPADWRAYFNKMEASYTEQVETMVNLKSFGGYLISLVVLAFVPALCEETLFRGGLQNFLEKATGKPWLSIIIISVLFSLAHFSFYGFLPRFFLGIMLGTVFYYTGNLWLSIFAHFFNNALSLTQLYIVTQQGKNIKAAMNEDTPFYWGLVVLPVFFLLLRILKKSVNSIETNSLG